MLRRGMISKSTQLRLRVRTAVGLDKPHDDVEPLPPRLTCVLQHGVGLADAWRGPDVDPQPRALRILHAREHLIAGRTRSGLHTVDPMGGPPQTTRYYGLFTES